MNDSDDLATQRLVTLTAALHQHASLTLPESDSLNETLSPTRPQRRRRKFKRPQVDGTPMTDATGTVAVDEDMEVPQFYRIAYFIAFEVLSPCFTHQVLTIKYTFYFTYL